MNEQYKDNLIKRLMRFSWLRVKPTAAGDQTGYVRSAKTPTDENREPGYCRTMVETLGKMDHVAGLEKNKQMLEEILGRNPEHIQAAKELGIPLNKDGTLDLLTIANHGKPSNTIIVKARKDETGWECNLEARPYQYKDGVVLALSSLLPDAEITGVSINDIRLCEGFHYTLNKDNRVFFTEPFTGYDTVVIHYTGLIRTDRPGVNETLDHLCREVNSALRKHAKDNLRVNGESIELKVKVTLDPKGYLLDVSDPTVTKSPKRFKSISVETDDVKDGRITLGKPQLLIPLSAFKRAGCAVETIIETIDKVKDRVLFLQAQKPLHVVNGLSVPCWDKILHTEMSKVCGFITGLHVVNSDTEESGLYGTIAPIGPCSQYLYNPDADPQPDFYFSYAVTHNAKPGEPVWMTFYLELEPVENGGMPMLAAQSIGAYKEMVGGLYPGKIKLQPDLKPVVPNEVQLLIPEWLLKAYGVSPSQARVRVLEYKRDSMAAPVCSDVANKEHQFDIPGILKAHKPKTDKTIGYIEDMHYRDGEEPGIYGKPRIQSTEEPQYLLPFFNFENYRFSEFSSSLMFVFYTTWNKHSNLDEHLSHLKRTLKGDY